MGALRPVACAFVEAWDLSKVNRMGQFGAIKDRLHPILEILGPDYLIVVITNLNERRNMPGLRGPMACGTGWCLARKVESVGTFGSDRSRRLR
jgi:hypothetical protein